MAPDLKDASKPAAAPDKALQPELITAIDAALGGVGPFGEVHLVIEDGRVRFIRTLKGNPETSEEGPKQAKKV